MSDGDPSATGWQAELADLYARVAQLEARVLRIRGELRTERLVVLDADERERLVAEVVDDILEVRIELPPVEPGRRTALLGFSAPRSGQLAGGLGVQLWADGDLVNELCWWEDDDEGEKDEQG